MKTHLYLPLVILLIFGIISCKESTQEAAPASKVEAPISNKKKRPSPRLQKREGKPLFRIEAPHFFSTPQLPDKFVLELDGPKVISGSVVFTISTYQGEELHKEEFPATAMIDKGCEAPASDTSEQEYYIIQRLKGFFVNGNFEMPAVNGATQFDPKASQKAIWKEIEADSTAISFYYLVGERDAKEIVWSKKQKKVLVLKKLN